jgi:hypothetical protein
MQSQHTQLFPCLLRLTPVDNDVKPLHRLTRDTIGSRHHLYSVDCIGRTLRNG